MNFFIKHLDVLRLDMQVNNNFNISFYFSTPTQRTLATSVTRLCDFFYFGQVFKAFGNNNLSKSPTFLGNFVKVSKSIIFLVKLFWATFCRHLTIFFWSHCSPLPTACRSPTCSLPRQQQKVIWHKARLSSVNSVKDFKYFRQSNILQKSFTARLLSIK